MPTAPINIFSNKKLEPTFPGEAKTMAVKLKASTNYLRGTVLGELTASPGTFAAYASGNVDGSQLAKVILAYDCATDASGNITFSATANQVGGEFGIQQSTAEVYWKGQFNTTELVGLDAGAITAMGRLIQGVLANGILSIQ